MLASSMMPTLLKPWPESCCVIFKSLLGTEDEAFCLTTASERAKPLMTSLPLLQQHTHVVCKICSRPVLLSAFEEHSHMCASLPRPRAASPGDELRAGSPSLKVHAHRAKSPVPPGPRPSSTGAAGLARASSAGSNATCQKGRGCPLLELGENHMASLLRRTLGNAGPSRAGQHGLGGRPPKMPKRGTSPHGTGGAKGAELRRLQFARGELTVDDVCGVTSGDKVRVPGALAADPSHRNKARLRQVCLHKLNCKYHNLALKRMVAGRSRPFDQPRAVSQRPPCTFAPRAPTRDLESLSHSRTGSWPSSTPGRTSRA